MTRKLKSKKIVPALMLALLACSTAACTEALQPEATPAVIITAPPSGAVENTAPPPPVTECTCTAPAGMLAPHGVPKPSGFNTKTPGDTLVVGTPPMRGDFVRGWGSSMYDLSVKTLTGGFRDTFWVTADGRTVLNESVVCDLQTEYDTQGNKTFTFVLHRYNKWNNGESITARDYIAGILAYASPAFVKYGGTSLIGDGIVGYEAYHQGTGGGEPLAYFQGIRMLDDYRFSVTVSNERLPYFWETSLVTFAPVYMKGWFPGNDIISGDSGSRFNQPVDGDMERISTTERYAPTVTCGPYTFESYGGGVVRLVRNGHFGVCPEGYIPYFGSIVQIELADDIAINMLRNGDLDLMQGIDITAWEFTEDIIAGEPEQWDNFDEGVSDAAGFGENSNNEYIDTPDMYIGFNSYMRAGYGFMDFAIDYGPAQEYNVRLAIAHMLDRDAVIINALGGNGVTVNGAYSPAQWVYDARSSEFAAQMIPIVYNPVRANELLSETQWVYESDGTTPFDPWQAIPGSGYLRHNADGEALHISVCSASQNVARALNAAAQAGAPLIGMEFTIEIIDAASLLDNYYNAKTWPVRDRKYHAYQLAIDFPVIDDKFWSYHSSLADSYLNSNGVRDEELDRIVMAMRSLDAMQTDEHADYWLEFQLRWQQVLPSLPLYVNQYYDAFNSIVTHVPASAYSGYHDVIMHIAKHK